jgi:putative ABC transport system substrate-binding protein
VDLSGKRLELLKELAPEVSRIAFLVTPAYRGSPTVQEMQRAAQALGGELQILEVSSPDEFTSACSTMHAAGAGALLLPANPFVFERHHRDITALALQSRMPTIYPWRMYPEAGGIMSYGPSLRAIWQRTATYVDKLLKGAKPADLPVEQPMTFELVINLKTATVLGITILPTLLFQADEVIR